ncbi:LamG domain-containing protein [Opitutaceae bacterium TAV4]|nr:LamG domain-containing protein [Opitutaceae bacterium TAV4]RRK02044.1 LamG domain-containing protein [Opitutaceae bacterium TAV3]
MLRTYPVFLTLTLILPLAALDAATVAWWRFDNDGFAEGQSPTQREDVIRDETGANPGRTSKSPVYSAEVPFVKLAVASAKNSPTHANTLSLRMNNPKSWEDVFITKKPVCDMRLPAYTIELSFQCADIAMFRAILGKDGKPTESPAPPFVAKLSPRNQKLIVETLDESGQRRSVSSKSVIETGVWYNVAVVNDGKQLALWLKKADAGAYELQAKINVEGGLIDSSGNWVIGRGMSNGKLADPFHGYIDEIRISDTALAADNFLTAAER